MTISTQEYERRHALLRDELERRDLDAVIAYATPKMQGNVRWLASYYVRFVGMSSRPDGTYGAFGSCACLFPQEGEPQVLTDQVFDLSLAQDESFFKDVVGTQDMGVDLAATINARGYRRVAIDNWSFFPAVAYLALRERCPDVEFVGEYFLDHLRRVKSAEEIVLLRKAEAIADEAVQAALDAVRVGVSEYEVALIAEQIMRERGDIETGASIVASAGVNTVGGSSLPTREKRMERGELFLLDVAPRVEGYPGDIARMRVAGDLDDVKPLHRRAYDTTVLMNEEVRKAIKPGVRPKDLTDLAQAVADGEGMGEYRRGADLLGHGMGIDIHGMPDYFYDQSELSVGEVIAVEPMLILHGELGTRVEDVILVTEGGCETLSTTPRTLTGAAER